MENSNSYISGIGSYLPSQMLTNKDLEKMVDTTDEWIVSRTGIKKRYISAKEEATSDLATKASLSAIEDAGISPNEINMIIVATFTPDMMLPSTATRVQKNIGANNASAFDISAACSGFIYGLSIAHQFIINGTMKNVLVIGAETITKYVDWSDRNTSVLFGDGAGAVVVSQNSNGAKILGFNLGANGNPPREWLMLAGGGSVNRDENILKGKKNFITMNGKEIFKFGVNILPATITTVVKKYGLTNEDIDLVIPHQANRRIIEAAAVILNIPIQKFYINIDRYANTSAASIPIAMFDARKENILNKGDIIVLAGFGAGLTWGSMLIKY
ncbi:MAG: ketoacyl-ACP synthase III [Ignavibacteriaceae bacterium]|nr:ketoacyl-ACP synthase III [Ignavibacteriaceae bacterium]